MPEIPLPDPPLRDGDLLLRPWSLDDVPAAMELLHDPEIPRWTTIPPNYTERDGREFMGGCAARRAAGETLDLAAVDADDGTLLGGIGLHKFDWEHAFGEMGYWVGAPARRRRVATRAVRLLGGYGLGELGLRQIEITVHIDNHASQRVAERAGAIRGGLARREIGRHGMCDVVLFTLTRAPTP